jgi:hypothetical protein
MSVWVTPQQDETAFSLNLQLGLKDLPNVNYTITIDVALPTDKQCPVRSSIGTT